MHDPKTLWRLARRRETARGSPWVSASRDSEAYSAAFKAWLDSIPVKPESRCFVIMGPHSASETIWKEALTIVFSSPEGVGMSVLMEDLRSVVILTAQGVAQFIAADAR